MRATFQLEEESRNELEKEKEQVAKEVIKEHLLRIVETEEAIKEATRLHCEAKLKYAELISDNNLLMKLCLKKVSTQPIKTKN
jgi:hypothetical protein